MFLLRPVGRRDPSAGPEPKINTSQFFFCSGTGERQGKERPVGRRHESKKKHHPGCFVFCSGPAERSRRPTGNKKTTLCTPGDDSKKNLETNDTGHEQKGATTKKKPRLTHCSPGPRCSLTSFPGRLFRPGPAVFFFCCGPARTLTHSLQAWAAMPPAGVVFFFFCCGPARTGVCAFFVCCGPARTLTHSLWAGAISARPGWCFFLLRPRTRRANNKKCLVDYIGWPQQKKTPLPGLRFRA